MPNDNVMTIPRDLLQDLIDDVSDYAASREFKPREKVWRDDVLARARAILATPQPEMRAEVTGDDKLCADRYRLLRRGQHWSVINGIGDTLRADELDAAIDAARTGASS